MKLAPFAIAIALSAALPAGAGDQPYGGFETRGIAALSGADIEGLLEGRGMGYALPAELNGYPGPTHVLDAAEALELTPGQAEAVRAVFDRMNARARVLGAEFVAAEAALDAAFGDGTVTPEVLGALTAEAARIEADLRATHLAAHLEITPILTRHQIAAYNRLRGYAAGDAHGGGHGRH